MQMWYIYWIIMTIIIFISYGIGAEHSDIFEVSVSKLFMNLNLQQVNIFTCDRLAQENQILQEIAKLPFTSYHFHFCEIDINGTINLESIYQSKYSNLNIILESNINIKTRLKRIYNFLNFIIKLSPATTRQRCLIIFIGDKVFNESEKEIKVFLEQTWKLKFLDFSIVELNNKKPSVVFYLNPFTEIVVKNEFDVNSILFPDKLANMHGYKFKVPMINRPPYLIIMESRKNKTTRFEGSGFSLLKILSRKFNFTLDLKKYNKTVNLTTIFDLFKNDGSMMSVIPVLLNAVKQTDFVIGRMLFDEKFVMIVPILKESALNVPRQMFLYLCCFIIILICFVIIVYALDFPLRHWRIIDIYQILLGVSLSSQPREMIQRIIYLSLILVSMKYSGETFATLTDVRVEEKEKSFKTFEEIVDSKIPIYMSRLMQKEIYNRTDEIFQMLRTEPLIYERFEDCLHTLRRYKIAICITTDIHGRFVVGHAPHRRSRNSRRSAKLAKPSLYPDKATYFYESGSPFAERIDRTIRRIYEAGIPGTWRIKQTYDSMVQQTDDEIVKESIFLEQILVILMCGYSLAAVVLGLEFIVSSIRTSKPKIKY